MRRFAWWLPGWLLGAALLCGGGGASAAASPGAALEMVRDTAQTMLDAFLQRRAELERNPEELYALVHEVVLPHFDFERMSRIVLGRYWRKASPEQRERFVREFRDLLVRSYSTALFEYKDQDIVYLPMRGAKRDGYATVRTEVHQSGTLPIPVHYSLYATDGRWMVYDVVIDNVSLVTNYRSSFANEIRRHGIDALIGRLAAQNAEAVRQ